MSRSHEDPVALARSVVDEEEIRAVLNHYAFCIDRRMLGRLADEVFTEQSTIDHGYGRWEGGSAAAAAFEKILEDTERSAHVLTNMRVQVDGDAARSTTYVAGWHWQKRDQPSSGERPADFVILGVYVDRLRRTERGWRILERRATRLAPGPAALGELPASFWQPSAG